MARATRVPRRGLTVIELVVALALVAVVFTGLSGVVRTLMRLTRLHEDRLDVQQGARRALERIVEELRWADGIVPVPECGPNGLCPDRVRVHVPAGNPYRRSAAYDVTFQHNPRQHEVERRVGVGTTNLAALVRRVEFVYLDRHGASTTQPAAVVRLRVRLIVTARDNQPVVVESDVALRNRRTVAVLTPSPTPTASPVSPWRPTPRLQFGPGSPWSQDSPPPYDSPGLR
ncbi:MAG: prepilin-type N-terminal cleavage/methylation domain-containing protein [Armatimonadota bacterium]|nr:prepilin-type N-terminal cleavage/methylation domain-containing protein [Armatimonadota bacterium]